MLLILLTLFSLGARNTQKTSSTTYGFIGPKIVKADENASRLHVVDLNGDGKSDLVYLKAGASEIVLLHQKDDGKYEETTLTPDRNIRRLCVGNFNKDNRPDLAFLELDEDMVVMFQGKDGKFDSELEFEIKANDLRTEDINSDGLDDLLAISAKKLFAFYQNAKGKLEQPVKLANPCKAQWFLGIADIDGNGFKDILLRHPNTRAALPVRFQTARGVFGMEIQFKTEDQVLYRPFMHKGDSGSALLLSLRNRPRAAKVLRLKNDKDGELALSLPRVFGFSNPTSKKSFAVADFDGDKKTDVLVVDAAMAQMFFYFQGKHGLTGDYTAHPCLAGVSQIALIPGGRKGSRAIVMASPEEKMLAVTEIAKNGSFPFPTRINFDGEPSGVVALLPAEKKTEIVVAAVEKRKTKLFLLTRKKGAEFTCAPKSFYESKEKCSSLHAVDANSDGISDLLVFFRYTDPVLLVRSKDGSFKDLTKAKTFDQGLLTKLKPSSFSITDMDADGRSELMVCRKNFARVLSVDAEKESIRVARQFNGAEATSSIVRSEFLDVDGDGKSEVLLFDAAGGALKISIFAADKNNVIKHKKTIPIGAYNILDIYKTDFNSDGRTDLLIAAKDKMAVILSGVHDPKLSSVALYKTTVEESDYYAIYAGDVGGDERKEILALEQKKHNLEILSLKGNTLKQELAFPVFEEREDVFRSFFFRSGKMGEPRDLQVADIDGDGRNDIIMLAHKNILIYRQEK